MGDVDRSRLPIRRKTFDGIINRTLDGSQPDWNLIGHPTAARGRAERPARPHRRRRLREPEHVRRPDPDAELHPRRRGRGCATTGSTSPRCARRLAPALLTGRNNHAVGFGSIGEFAGGFPGYSAILPRDCAPLPRILRDNGYSTAAFGKWHLTPDGQQGPAGPFDRWPNGWGFDYFYGILGGGSSQWDPCLAENQKIIGTDPRFYDDEDPYYFPDAMADRTIAWLHGVRGAGRAQAVLRVLLDRLQPRPAPRREGVGRQVQGEVRPGMGQAPRGDVRAPEGARRHSRRRRAHAAQRGVPGVGRRFRQAEGVLRAPDGGVRRLLRERGLQRRSRDRRDRRAGRARQHADPVDLGRQRRQHGRNDHRVVQRADDAERHPADRRDAAPARRALRRPGCSGAPRSWIRTTAPRGRGPGTRRSSGASRSARTSAGRATRWSCTGPIASTTRAGCVRSSRTSSTSRPTILDVAGIPAPESVDGIEQEPMHGSTFAASFTDAGAPEHRTQQYFETIGNRGMYKDGWWLAMKTDRIPWVLTPDALAPYAPGRLGPGCRSRRAVLPPRRLHAGARCRRRHTPRRSRS